MQAKNTVLSLAVSGLLACGVLSACSAANSAPAAGMAAAPAATSPSIPAAMAPAAGPVAFTSAPNYRAIVAANRTAVVGITTEGSAAAMHSDDEQGDDDDNQQGPQDQQGLPDDPLFRYFFRGMPRQHGRGDDGDGDDTPMHALGSGFIVRSDGVILTNAHVVHGARQVTVTLSDHREYKAKVLGQDKATDVAVLKIDAHNLPVVHLGSTNGLEVGDYVLAIGAPYGLEETATAGIVSAKGRSLPNDQSVPFLQTDVAVNPGNSGGPLFDAHGNVVGINSQIYSNTGGFEGVSFAIPIEVAAHVQDQILKTGKVEHARLGVNIQPVNQQLARSFNLATPAGALVSKVEDDSAAAHAGLKAGDVIMKFDGNPVLDPGQLSAEVSMAQPGEAANLDVWRNGRSVHLTAKLGGASAQAMKVSAVEGSGHGKLGIAVRPLTEQERSEAGVQGLLVERANGAAARAGIQPGDVVLAIDGTPVTSTDQLKGIVDHHGDTVALLVQRGDARIFVPVQMGGE